MVKIKKLSKTKLIKTYKAGCLNDYGKNRLIDIFLKEEEIKKQERIETIRRKCKLYHRKKRKGVKK